MKKIVIKLGTTTLTKGTKSLSRPTMLELVRQIHLLHEKGTEIVMITSGAVAAGREALNFPKTDRSLPFKQMLASIGQVHLMHTWSEFFGIYNIVVGQILLIRSDFNNRHRYLNVRDTLMSLLSHKVIPIINENDTVATEEVKVGDNDNLSAHVANLIGADLLVLLTDQQGLYTADPRTNPDAQLIHQVESIDESIFALAGGSSTTLGLGTGGMITKIEAAQLATQGGTPTLIASSWRPNILLEIKHGLLPGTFFPAASNPRESKKRWLLSEKIQGHIYIDRGACENVLKKGASLLPVGIVKTSHPFDRGAIVQIRSLEGIPVAMGICNYSSQDIEKILGVQSEQIEERLTYSYGEEVIHRDDMTVLK